MLHPNDTITYTTESGAEFKVRVGTVREWEEYDAKLRALETRWDTAAARELAESMIADGDVGALAPAEMYVMIGRLPAEVVVQGIDRKKSESPSPSSAENSAPVAGRGAA